MPAHTTRDLARRGAGAQLVSDAGRVRGPGAPDRPSEARLWGMLADGRAWNEAGFVRGRLEQAGLESVEVVRRKVDVDFGTPDVFMMTVGGMLGVSSKQCSEHVRERWLVQIGEAMEGILVQEAGGVDKHVFMEFEGIVGVGVKGE